MIEDWVWRDGSRIAATNNRTRDRRLTKRLLNWPYIQQLGILGLDEECPEKVR